MSRSLLIALASLLAIPSVADARGYRTNKSLFGPVPTTRSSRAPTRALRVLGSSAQRSCIPKKWGSLIKLVKHADKAIFALPAAERQPFIAYRNKITKYLTENKGGIAGVGTWAEVQAYPAKAEQWYRANKPTKGVKTVAGVKAYLAKLRAYEARAAKDRRIRSLISANPCTRNLRLGAWPGMITTYTRDQMRLRAIRHHLPRYYQTRPAREFVKKYTNATFKRRIDQGRMLHDAVSLYTSMKQEAELAPAIIEWIGMLEPKSLEYAKAEIVEHAALQKKIAALYASEIRKVRLPKKSRSGKAQRIARRLLRKQVRVHATSGINRVNNPQSEIFRARGKLWKRTWNESLDEIEIWYISRDKPRTWFVDMPGVPLKKVCSLKVAAAHRYRRGISVPLNKWLLEEDNQIAPILCKAR